MRSAFLSYLRCVTCAGDLVTLGASTEGELLDGRLCCERCNTTIPVVKGVPRADGSDEAEAKVASAFSYQWKAYSEKRFGGEYSPYGGDGDNRFEHFLAATNVEELSLPGLAVLDAGCGPASISRSVAEHGARAVVALDITDSIDTVCSETRRLTNFHAIQGDLFCAPLRANFDIVWSAGVIHHTDDAAGAFRALTRYVRPGGLLYVWIYPRNLRPFHWGMVTQWTQALLRRLGVGRASKSTVFRVADALSYPTAALHTTYRAARRLPGLAPRTANARDSVRPLTRQTFQLIWNDALIPPYTSWHSEREVRSWFRVAGFTDVKTAVTRPLGMSGRAPLE